MLRKTYFTLALAISMGLAEPNTHALASLRYSKLADQIRFSKMQGTEMNCSMPTVLPSSSYSKLLEQVKARKIEEEKGMQEPESRSANSPLPPSAYSKLLEQEAAKARVTENNYNAIAYCEPEA